MYLVKKIVFFGLLPIIVISCLSPKRDVENQTVKEVMDRVITRLYQEIPEDKYNSIDDQFMLELLTREEKEVLATQYQYFKVNVPVMVSVIRSTRQQNIPFWLEESGFEKKEALVRNEVYEYEVWQKEFDAGWVHLGINGFDMHRTVYFVCVGPIDQQLNLEISAYYPSQYEVIKMEKGAFTYHDWSSLLIEELPDELEGQKLFTTVRGRAREAHVIGAFRKTPFPASQMPDQLLQTWSGNPATAIDIQWRTNQSVETGLVKYWIEDSSDTLITVAQVINIEDRMLYNDRYVNRFTATLTKLKPGTAYNYLVGSHGKWSDIKSFTTQQKNQTKFSFIWFGDTHRDPVWGELLQKANETHPETSFYSIAGDLVSTGLYRNEWDELFGYSGDVFSQKPLMPVLGNHDRQDGLGSWMYYELFSLPSDAPEGIHKESTYAFEYGNALFLMLDCTHPIEQQSEWIEEQLRNSTARWKFAMFHFPPYNFEEPYPDIQEAWCTIFDKHHVDLVMSGHIHYYMRSKPMKGGEVVHAFEDGTVYTVSIGTHGNHDDIGEEPYAQVRYKEGQFYQFMEIDNNVLNYTAYNQNGQIKDRFSITKSNRP